ncbi:MAG: Rieske 2Fe-2S domain-containing protein [Salinisphaeraceae bacterium]|nr:Rieske 2Fe-2S domain-containing protein [Salinisphaeraceae bacterium]
MSETHANLNKGAKDLARCPFPIPMGWFFVDYSENLAKGEIRNVNLLDQEWTIWRGESGKVSMSDPYCPHLGAHMGHGGTVQGDNIRCPFHHWQFDGDGWNKDIPYGKVTPPICKKQAILRTLPIFEKWGLIFCWYHPNGEAPIWEMPEIEELSDTDNYVEPHRGEWTAATAVQEIAENGVDFAHLRFLHGEKEIPPAEYSFDWPYYNVNMNNGYIVGKMFGPGLNVYKFTHEGVTATMVNYTQPVDKENSIIRMSFTHKKYEEGTKEAMIAQHLVAHMVGSADGKDSAGFEEVDFIVWNNKKYRPNPLLCDGDGPIIQYRKFFSKFYDGSGYSE